MVQVRVNVHWSPSKSWHAWMEFEFHVVNVRCQQVFANWFNFCDNSFIFFQNVEKFVVVHFELFFLEQNDSCTLWNWNALSVQTLGFSDQLHDIDIKVDIKLLLGFVSDNKCSLKSGLGSFDFLHPQIIIPHFIDGQHFTQSIVISIILLDFWRMDNILWKFGDRACNFLIQMFWPYNFACILWHVSHNWWIWFLIVEDSLNGFKLRSVIGQNCIVLWSQVVF